MRAMSGPRFRRAVPEGDNRERQVCDSCGFIHYDNPKIVAGAVVRWTPEDGEDRLLLCRRAIEPRRGWWTLPAGFLEVGESPAEGAQREAREEACAEITITGLLGIYSIHHIAQVMLIYDAHLAEPRIAVGPESEEVALLRWDEIPWDQLAFDSVPWALERWRERRRSGDLAPAFHPPLGAGIPPAGTGGEGAPDRGV